MYGKLKEDPGTQTQVGKGRSGLKQWGIDHGQTPASGEKDIKQNPNLRLLQAFLRICLDPDAEAIDCFCEGVRLGHNMKMPRTPAIYEEKERWRIKYVDQTTAANSWAPNYKTARDRLGALEKKIEEDMADGKRIMMPYGAANQKYGDRLLLGSMR